MLWKSFGCVNLSYMLASDLEQSSETRLFFGSSMHGDCTVLPAVSHIATFPIYASLLISR